MTTSSGGEFQSIAAAGSALAGGVVSGGTLAATADMSQGGGGRYVLPVKFGLTQIRSQGFGCNQPTTAERDRFASIPDEGVWLLQCEHGSYRVRLIPHLAAKVERVGQ